MSYDVTCCPAGAVTCRPRWHRGPPGGEGAAVHPGHQPDVSAAGGQRPGGPSHHPLCQVCTGMTVLWVEVVVSRYLMVFGLNVARIRAVATML